MMHLMRIGLWWVALLLLALFVVPERVNAILTEACRIDGVTEPFFAERDRAYFADRLLPKDIDNVFPLERVQDQRYREIFLRPSVDGRYSVMIEPLDGQPLDFWVIGKTPEPLAIRRWIIMLSERTTPGIIPDVVLVPFSESSPGAGDGFGDAFGTAFADEDMLPDCQPPMWGAPTAEPIDLLTLIDDPKGLNAAVYYGDADDAAGAGVRIGVLDTTYVGFGEAFAASPVFNYTVGNFADALAELPVAGDDAGLGQVVQLTPDGQPLDSTGSDDGSTEADHGTHILQIVQAIAPDAQLFAARATDETIGEAVAALIAAEVRLIVHAGNAITAEPAPYYAAVEAAQAAGILWINSAGNIGAGYLRDGYVTNTGEQGLHSFERNNQLFSARFTVRIPVDMTNSVDARLIWSQENTADGSPYDLQLEIYEFTTTSDGSKIGMSDAYQRPIPLPTPSDGSTLLVGTPVPSFEAITLTNLPDLLDDTVTLPVIEGVDSEAGLIWYRTGTSIDGYPDNEIYISVDTRGGSDLFANDEPFELYIKGALPRGFDPDIWPVLTQNGAAIINRLYPFDPVVLVPADMATVLTVGAFTPSNPAYTDSAQRLSAVHGADGTEALLWNSSRSNSLQFINRDANGDEFNPYWGRWRAKPEISTYGEISADLDEDGITDFEFYGTSAATAIAGGAAALIAAKFPDADAEVLRGYLRASSSVCLADSAVGQRLTRLRLLPPDQLNGAVPPSCGSDSTWIEDRVGLEVFRSRDAITANLPNVSVALASAADLPIRVTGEDYVVIGQAFAPTAIGYAVELAPTASEAWRFIGAPNEAPSNELATLCARADALGILERTIEPSAGRELARVSVDETLIDGAYDVRVTLCDSTNALLLDGQDTERNAFLVANSAALTVISPQPDDVIGDEDGEVELIVRGDVFADSQLFAGYVIQLVRGDADSGVIIAPEAIRNPNASPLGVGIDLCAEVGGFPDAEDFVVGTDVEMAKIALSQPQDSYRLIVRQCITTPRGRITFPDPIEVAFEIATPIVLSVNEMVNQLVDGRVQIRGSASRPEASFNHYIVEIILDDPESLTWTVLVGPELGGPDIPVVERCSIAVGSGAPGTRPIIDNVLAELASVRIAGDYRVRVTLCGQEPADASEVEATLRIEASGEQLPPYLRTSPVNTDLTFTLNEDAVLRMGPEESASAITDVVTSGVEFTLLESDSTTESLLIASLDGTMSGWIRRGNVAQARLGTLVLNTMPSGDNSPEPTSPVDPSRIFYVSDKLGSWQVYRAVVGSNQGTQLTTLGNNEFPSLSPRGNKVAFASDRDGNREIYIMNVDGTEQRNVSNNLAEDYRPVWSPDGARLLFESNRDGLRNLYVLVVDTQAVTVITVGSTVPCCVGWSSDGAQIVYSGQSDGNYDIFVAQADGSGTIRLTDFGESALNPVWQPGGNRIVFESTNDGTSEIYTVQANGGDIQQLTSGDTESINPSWTRDGRQIIFSSNRSGVYAIYIMNVDGSGERLLFNDAGAEIASETG